MESILDTVLREWHSDRRAIRQMKTPEDEESHIPPDDEPAEEEKEEEHEAPADSRE